MIVIRTKKPIDHSQNVSEERINVLEFRANKNKSFNDSELRVDFKTFKVESQDVYFSDVDEEGNQIRSTVTKEFLTEINYHVKGGVNSLSKVNGLAEALHAEGLPENIDPVRPLEYLNWMIAKATVLVISDKDNQINKEDLEIISY